MTDCIRWHKSLNERGYGQAWLDGKNISAHRAEWIKAFGPIPATLVVDHNCHNEAAARGECEGGVTCEHRACVNLEHLRLITQSENIKSGSQSRDVRGACPKGHRNNDANTMIRKNGKRECAECNRIRARLVWANRKVAA